MTNSPLCQNAPNLAQMFWSYYYGYVVGHSILFLMLYAMQHISDC